MNGKVTHRQAHYIPLIPVLGTCALKYRDVRYALDVIDPRCDNHEAQDAGAYKDSMFWMAC